MTPPGDLIPECLRDDPCTEADQTAFHWAIRPEYNIEIHGSLAGVCAGITLNGSIGARYRIDYQTNVTASVWYALREITLVTSPQRFIDEESGDAPQRFYRVVLLE